MGLSECMKLVARMSRADQDDLLQRVDDYIANGIEPAQAQRMAANDLLAEIEDDRREVGELADREIAAREPQDEPAEELAASAPAPEVEQAPEAPSPGFAAALGASLAAAKTNAGDHDYWLKRIDAAAQSGVVDRKDVKLSGIEGWLREQGGKIRKDAVLERLGAAAAPAARADGQSNGAASTDRGADGGSAPPPSVPTKREPPAMPPARPDGWTAPAPSRLDRVIYELQDKQVDLKRVTEAVRESVGELTDRQDAYLREELFHGRVADRTARFLDKEIKPLTVEMRAAGVSLDELERYLHARHASERNAAMKAINADREDNEALSGMSDAEAAEILREAKPVMPRLAARVDAMISGTRDLLEVAGLETPETVQALRETYHHYVPLHRDEAHADSHQLIGSGFNVKGTNLKRATGSTARVTNILAHVIEQREATIVRAEKNLVGMALYSMALKAPNADFWKADTPPKIKVIGDDGQVHVQSDPSYKSRVNVFTLKVGGQERTVTFNERDERAMRMALALKNLDADALDLASGLASHGTRWLASINTQYNPVFALTNGIRDLQGAMVNLTSTPVNGKQAQIIHDAFRHAYAAVWRAERAGETDAAGDEWVRLYRELSSRGGLTGWRDSYTAISDRAKALQAGMASLDDGAVKQAGKAALELVADLNSSVENGIRLAVYKAGLDAGLSKDRAASVAKNITVNFNRKGRAGRTLGAWYAFLNASVQGTARLAQTLKGPGGKYIVLGGIGLGVLQAAMLAGMSDDDEEALQDFEREKNLIFPLGKGKYVKIPLALGLHVLPNIGRHLGEMAFAAKDGKRVDATRHLTQLFSTLFDAFSPVGGAANAMQVIAPSVADPLVQLEQNKDFAGRPIYRERSEFTGFKSGASLGKDSTNPAYRVLADWINRISGGEDGVRNLGAPRAASPQPEAIRFIVETVGGGVWREAERLIDAMIAAATPGGQVEPNRLPLGGRFWGDLTGPQAPASKFYDNLNEIQTAAKAVDALKKSDDPRADEKIEALLQRRPEAGLAKRASRVRRAVGKLRERRHQMLIDSATDAELREVDEEIAQVMREFNEAVREARR